MCVMIHETIEKHILSRFFLILNIKTLLFCLQRKLLDLSLGFAAGVMTAASYWSLLKPAIEMCDTYGEDGKYAFVPVAGGFLCGAVFVYGTDRFLDYLGINSTNMMISKCFMKYYFLSYFLMCSFGIFVFSIFSI